MHLSLAFCGLVKDNKDSSYGVVPQQIHFCLAKGTLLMIKIAKTAAFRHYKPHPHEHEDYLGVYRSIADALQVIYL